MTNADPITDIKQALAEEDAKTTPTGATLRQVGTNLGYQIIIASVALILFGIAIWRQWNSELTPRAANRPLCVLKNVLLNPTIGRKGKGTGTADKNGTTTSWDWFNKLYALSWLRWTSNLTYQQALEGVPGTGSRADGWDGRTLQLNLDGVILLKYHRMLAKIAGLATLLCIAVILPVYKTATCDPFKLGAAACLSRENLTDFEQLTVIHIPAKQWQPLNYTTTIQLDNGTVVTVDQQTTRDTDGDGDSDILGYDTTWRIALVTLCTMIIYIYTCYLLWNEWIDNLALRRAFYLEANHYSNRKTELDRLAVLQQRHGSNKGTDGCSNVENNDSGDFFKKKNRPPNVCNPELRDTPPSIGLYSVLYQLPSSLLTYESDGHTQTEREQAATARFFDECIPNQAGFSSSVAAVTVIPNAQSVAKVWTQWYTFKSKLRRLRFIRKTLAEKVAKNSSTLKTAETSQHRIGGLPSSTQSFDEGVDRSNDTAADSNGSSPKHQTSSNGSKEKPVNDDVEDPPTAIDQNALVQEVHTNENVLNREEKNRSSTDTSPTEDENEVAAESATANSNPSNLAVVEEMDNEHAEETIDFHKEDEAQDASVASPKSQFEYDTFDVDEFSKQIGYVEETEINDVVDGLGIEQLNMFAYESTLAAGGMCIYGKVDQLILLASIEDLVEMEQEAVDDLEITKQSLMDARAAVAEDETDIEVGAIPVAIEPPLEEVANALSPRFSSAASSGLRNRGSTTVEDAIANQWEQAMNVKKTLQVVPESEVVGNIDDKKSKKSYMSCCRGNVSLPQSYGSALAETSQSFLSALDHPSYAIITFTSRQAAIAARQCLADGGSRNAWKQADDIPVPPLADAPPGDLLFFRGCCRPVTMRLSYKEKKLRRALVTVFLFFFFTLYTIPLSLVSGILVRGTNSIISDQNTEDYNAISGFMAGLANTLFFSFCPQLFKAVAFFEGTSSSLERAERKALLYYWLFMLVTAFTGTTLATLLLSWFTEEDVKFDTSFRYALNSIAETIPTERAPVWLNWIVFRIGFTLTLGYLFQLNTFLTKIFHLKWLNRVMKGGGSGSPTPYRIYVDSGVVFMCITSIAPVCPLIAPAALLYYLLFQPILRWLLVFVYKPKYNSGGSKWQQLHMIVISAMIFGQILLAVVLALRLYVAGIIIGVCAIRTYGFHLIVTERFGRAYRDAALLQTSHLDGWDGCSSQVLREEYRRWLVDCHKASYVPTCLLGSRDGSGLTIEPAYVVPRATDVDSIATEDTAILHHQSPTKGFSSIEVIEDIAGKRRRMMERQRTQRGIMFNPKYQ
mmetsp:Transcript_4818/g.12258  ORF Transcript_4818/g.12258 Transcript_4818/m.12258 type:complete len:1303 (-) Transcript_4818:886-4794(-)|eukprot:CAMPEP_0113474512 /NCGR_PEP_ID=MMETSP0014_2-20120614/18626_1 /TAXON_ID=2857 /ORGANISM="Nitzschia sp." /LENGTH=1302 /DNA_ID=CAMNT_0000367369 /DNA_START=132 /DNA_END=4040 /DNA_ORIENTATION=+ /assembly_acc=CAM_ASM_000159